MAVFSHGGKDKWLVKRIAYWPNGKLQHDGNWYFLGDNKTQSRDSRYFGGIASEKIIGQVKMVLLQIDNQQQLQKGSFFQSIK